MDKKLRNWLIFVIALCLTALIFTGTIIAVVDPYFHYHKPLSCIGYKLDNERYQNNGILRHFDYDAIITGSSMTENFKTSEFDELFGVKSVKVPFSGGSYKEVADTLRAAFKYNKSIKTVVRGLDCVRFFNDADDCDYDNYPDYLYDDNLFNDVNYLLNSEVLFVALQDIAGRDADGKMQIDFDKYMNWMHAFPIGIDAVKANYARSTVEVASEQCHMTDEERATIKKNITQNVIEVATENPGTEFYLYFTPYSIAFMDYYKLQGNLVRQLEAEKYIIELLVPYDNIHLYSFFLQEGIITDLTKYRDVAHHVEEYNSMILKWMKEGTGLLTVDNYKKYCEDEYEYLMNFDYDTFFADWD